MDDGVWILGGYQSDFARNLSKENRDFADLTREVVDGTLTAAKVDAADLAAAGVVHVANAFGEMFARQGHLGAMPATVCDDLWDTPATRHEAACASGSVATLAAMADLRSGAYRVALVVGLELEKTVPGDTAAEHLSAAAWTGHEGAEAYRPPRSLKLIDTDHVRRSAGKHRDEVLQRFADVGSQCSGDDHADRPEQGRAAEVHIEADDGAVLFRRYLSDQLDFDTTHTVAVERHALRGFVPHDRPLDPVGHALDLDIRLDDRALLEHFGQLAAPYLVDGQPLSVTSQIGGVHPGFLRWQRYVDGSGQFRHAC